MINTESAGPRFRNTYHKVSEILTYLRDSEPKWAIPRLQRPFVWNGKKVAELISSMYLGYPVGSILLWEAQGEVRLRGNVTGLERWDVDLVLDGQQRLTSLKILFEGTSVPTAFKSAKNIKVQFNPLLNHGDLHGQYFREYKGRLTHRWMDVSSALQKGDAFKIYESYKELNTELTGAEDDLLKKSIQRLLGLRDYTLACVVVDKSIDVESAAEIFYRINSKGVSLKGSDFILTLLEIGDTKLRDSISDFAHHCQKNSSPIFTPEHGDVVAALVAYTFGRAAGKNAYELLRGREKGVFCPERKAENFLALNKNVSLVCNTKTWDEFMLAISSSGITHSKLLTSEAALIVSYVIYLMMMQKPDAKSVSKDVRQSAIARWMLFCTLTKRYTSHTDTQTANDCSHFEKCDSCDAVVSAIHTLVDKELPEDYWRKPYSDEDSETMLTICLIQQGRQTLFAKGISLKDQYQHAKGGSRVQIHHIFPQNFMVTHPDESQRRPEDVTDVGSNKAPIDEETNNYISDKDPRDYVPEIKKRHKFTDAEWDDMCAHHGLPSGWHLMSFDAFIEERAKLIPLIIRRTLDHFRLRAM